MPLAPDVPYEIGDAAFGGYVAGLIDTTQGNIITADASQTGLRYMLIVAPKSLAGLREALPPVPAPPEPTVPLWEPGIAVNVGQEYLYSGKTVVVQAHTTQADWAPDVTPALWVMV